MNINEVNQEIEVEDVPQGQKNNNSVYQSRSDRTTKQVGEVQLLQIAKRLSKRKNPNIIAKKEKDRV